MLNMHRDNIPVLWRDLPGLVPYAPAMETMASEAAALRAGSGREQVWVLESPAGYSCGSGQTRPGDAPPGLQLDQPPRLLHPGGYWYHGPGALGLVVILDLNMRHRSVAHAFVALEQWLVDSMVQLGAPAVRIAGTPGVWVQPTGGKLLKLATIAITEERWVTTYGGAVLVNPDMAQVRRVNACAGDPAQMDVTSLTDLGITATRADVVAALKNNFQLQFGNTSDVAGAL